MTDRTKTPAEPESEPPRPAPVWKRVAALFYDSLFVFALLMLATLIALPLNHGEAFPQSGGLAWLYRGYLLLWVGAYFTLFWCIGGQTPGMKVWHIRVRFDGRDCLGRATLRFLGGLLSILLAGLPFWLSQIDPERRSVIDRRLGSRVIRTP
ncbi:hypothetical protein A9404_07130 [Halothiobacillus diazotrophicus]|uniref:RDD domain-containing protein n=1 Tax=Halothiobacillus diazotrophicus TaxID=1860122 RepID=A0A191ZH59_9GAMM|nr:RDD family protein [Halothiobacillus diazotrophicus]ANJ67188.1 hypothetical protein A9404_07130 [Halothiobacillus diazotrophicus]